MIWLLRSRRLAAVTICCGLSWMALNPLPGLAGEGQACARDPGGSDHAGSGGEPAYDWRLPEGFPAPRVPRDNFMSAAKVRLGRMLFFDTRLSADRGYSCATCHRPELAFTDGRALARGSGGELHPRSAPSLANVAYQRTLGWADPDLELLEEQAKVPLFNTRPVELGMAGREAELLARLAAEPTYRRAFARAYPPGCDPAGGSDPPLEAGITLDRVRHALASFVRTLISGGSPYDRWLQHGEADAMSVPARRGVTLFFSDRLGCGGCHRGFNLSGPVRYEGSPEVDPEFHNTGLYDIDGRGAYPPEDPGLRAVTGRGSDMGRYRIPTLRNVAVTGPYMHDGSLATLEQVIDFYARGGRKIPSGLHSGDGRDSPLKSERVRGFDLTAREREDLLAFLESLTDDGFLEDPRFSDPWK